MRIYSKQGRFCGEIIEVNVKVIVVQNHTGRLASSAFEAFAADKTQILNGSGLYFASFEAARAAIINWGEEQEQREADAANQDYNLDSW